MNNDLILRKKFLIREMLTNSVYNDDSGLIINLRERLMKWPTYELQNLKLIVDLKVESPSLSHGESKPENHTLPTT